MLEREQNIAVSQKIPESYPSGSNHTLWLCLVGNRRILASRDGQYLGPDRSQYIMLNDIEQIRSG